MNLQEFKIVEHTNQISESIWQEVIQWKHFEKDTIGKQLVRAADSISANLSEAYGRYSYADRKRFAYYARGSLCETINWLEITSKRGLMDVDTVTRLLAELDSLSLRINVYIKRLMEQ